MQFIDVCDLAAWIIEMAAERRTGTFNATGPDHKLEMGRLLEACEAVGGDAELTWVSEDFLEEHGVEPFTELPLWVPREDAALLTWTAAGLSRKDSLSDPCPRRSRTCSSGTAPGRGYGAGSGLDTREGAGVAPGLARCHPVECGLRDEMNLTHEYMHHRTGYRLGAGCCWIRIYKGAECDAPVVVCEELPGSEASLRGRCRVIWPPRWSGSISPVVCRIYPVHCSGSNTVRPAGAGQASTSCTPSPPTVPEPWARASCGASPSEPRIASRWILQR